MKKDKVLLNKATEPASGHTTQPATGPSLPPELLQEASVRLGWAGMIYAVAYALAYWVPFFVHRTQQPDAPFAIIENFFAVGSILTGVLVFLVSRYARLPPERFLDVGLVFAVVGAFGISMAEFWRGFPPIRPTVFLGVPWECVWILIIPVVAPNVPRKVLIASLLEATTGPLVLWYAAEVRGQNVSNSVISLATYFLFTTYLCAGIAYFTSRFVFHVGVRLKKAREIGSYELVSRLGEGGMGEVWVARHRMLARPAAMKLIRPELLGTDWRSRDRAIARFRREAKATALLGSTHTVDIYDFGLTEEGAFFYVMELLDGLSLETLVRRFGPVAPARAVHLLRQACHSLGEAHASGLIHRDIKPANIFTCRLGPDVDFVKVLDFGLVKRAEQIGDDPAHRRPRHGRDTRVHGAGDGAGAGRRGQPCGPLRARLRRLLAAHGRDGVHGRDADGDAHRARPIDAGAAITANRDLHSAGARRSRPGLPGERSRRPAADGRRSRSAPGRKHSRQFLARGRRSRMVAAQPPQLRCQPGRGADAARARDDRELGEIP